MSSANGNSSWLQNVSYNKPDFMEQNDVIDFENQSNKNLSEFPIEICDRKNIHWIFLDDNKIKTIPKEICNLKKLFWLTLVNNKIEEFPIDILSQLIANGLKRIDLRGNPIKNIPEYLLSEDPQFQGVNLVRIADFIINNNEKIKRRLIIKEFEDLINDINIHETKITKFIENNGFIINLYFNSIKNHSQVKCAWQNGVNKENLIPDFFIEKSNGLCDIIDFKLPNISKILVGKENREKFNSKMSEYVSQIENYRDYFDDKIHRDWIFSNSGIKVFKPSLILIAGRKNDFLDLEEIKKIQYRNQNLTIINYDEIIETLKEILKD